MLTIILISYQLKHSQNNLPAIISERSIKTKKRVFNNVWTTKVPALILKCIWKNFQKIVR